MFQVLLVVPGFFFLRLKLFHPVGAQHQLSLSPNIQESAVSKTREQFSKEILQRGKGEKSPAGGGGGADGEVLQKTKADARRKQAPDVKAER